MLLEETKVIEVVCLERERERDQEVQVCGVAS
jgi:hypothetical protein